MGYRDLYKQVWEKRCKEDLEGAVYCVCEVCGKRIYESQCTVTNFAHKLSKGSTPELKMDEDNILFCCASHHIENHMKGTPLE